MFTKREERNDKFSELCKAFLCMQMVWVLGVMKLNHLVCSTTIMFLFFLNDHNVVCFVWSYTTFILFFHIDPARNVVACAIANSVTQERRYNSYVSRGAPQWLQNVLVRETLYCC